MADGMSKRFENLKKIPPDPAAKLLSQANTKLATKLAAPVSAPVSVVLAELDEKAAWIDTLKLLSVALPPREATWWACLAARDLIGAEAKVVPPPLAAAEKWVFKPTEENRIAAKNAFEGAEPDDDTVYCAMAALYADGTLGPGAMNDTPAAPNAVPAAVLAMNLIAVRANGERLKLFVDTIVDRALDIARGGNGKVEAGGGAQVGG